MQHTMLFWDDQALFERENLVRKYGVAKPVGKLDHEGLYSNFPAPFVIRMEDGIYRMIYAAKQHNDTENVRYFVADSEDGIHFHPVDTRDIVDLPDRVADNEINFKADNAPADKAYEIGTVFTDPKAPAEERYKMLLTAASVETWSVDDDVLYSSDLLHWKQLPGAVWKPFPGSEPICSVLVDANEYRYTILSRPMWGDRRVGVNQTNDFKTSTPYELVLQCDGLDEPLAELYGMRAFPYRDRFVGFPFLYENISSGIVNKYDGGTMTPHLAYSHDGKHWWRGSHQPVIDREDPETVAFFGKVNHMVWLCGMIERDDDILLYAAGTTDYHGEPFAHPTDGNIGIYSLRKDGFVYFETEDADKEAVLASRNVLWKGGDLEINLDVKEATVALYDHSWQPIEGFGHEDCETFSGNAIRWTPSFKNGRTMDEFIGKDICIEIRFRDGRLYSVTGDMVPLMYIASQQYHKFGRIFPSL